jgi:hypothetical protein
MTDASGLPLDQLIGFDAPCTARPPALLYQVRQAATIESILLGLVECLKQVAIRYGGVSARTAGLGEGQALLALGRVGALSLAWRLFEQKRKGPRRSSPVEDQGRGDPVVTQPGGEGGGFPTAMGHGSAASLAMGESCTEKNDVRNDRRFSDRRDHKQPVSFSLRA